MSIEQNAPQAHRVGASNIAQQKPEEMNPIHNVDTSTWITTKQVAEKYGCAQSTLKRWIKEGDLKSHQTNPRSAHLVNPDLVKRKLEHRPHVRSVFSSTQVDETLSAGVTSSLDETSPPNITSVGEGGGTQGEHITPCHTTHDIIPPCDTEVSCNVTSKDSSKLEKMVTEENDREVMISKSNTGVVEAHHEDDKSKTGENSETTGKSKKRRRNRRPKHNPHLNFSQLLKLVKSLPVDQRLSLRNQLTRNLESHV